MICDKDLVLLEQARVSIQGNGRRTKHMVREHLSS